MSVQTLLCHFNYDGSEEIPCNTYLWQLVVDDALSVFELLLPNSRLLLIFKLLLLIVGQLFEIRCLMEWKKERQVEVKRHEIKPGV